MINIFKLFWSSKNSHFKARAVYSSSLQLTGIFAALPSTVTGVFLQAFNQNIMKFEMFYFLKNVPLVYLPLSYNLLFT